MIIDKSKPVLVTGANGYVASWLVKKLLESGITVHAAVRNPNDEKKVSHLKELAKHSKGSIKFFKTDLLTPGSYEEAMMGCELVFHTASPFTTVVNDPQKELIDPALKGTENVLNTALKVGTVRRIVLTSSCAAIYSDAIDAVNSRGRQLTEELWNTTSSLTYQPYAFSKTMAEKRAWEIASTQKQWDMVTINPSLVLGPALNPVNTTSESEQILLNFGNGTMKMGTPKLGLGVVDVRDVAEAHYRAGFTPEAHGRYITSGHNTDFVEMGKSLLPKYGDKYPIPRKALPKWLLMIFGSLFTKLMTTKFVRNNVNIPWRADTSKIQRELGMSFRPLKETMEEAFQGLIDAGLVLPK